MIPNPSAGGFSLRQRCLITQKPSHSMLQRSDLKNLPRNSSARTAEPEICRSFKDSKNKNFTSYFIISRGGGASDGSPFWWNRGTRTNTQGQEGPFRGDPPAWEDTKVTVKEVKDKWTQAST